MKVAIDGLLTTHHGQKGMLRLVDHEYAAMVHSSSTNPNSLVHPTTRLHICRYVKHLAKLQNTSSSLNINPEKLLETQQLWQHLTEDSDTVTVPVTTLSPATVNPPAQAVPLTEETIERMVSEILQRQQQQQQQTRGQKQKTKTCLSCGQPKSRFENDGSSIHFFLPEWANQVLLLLHQKYGAEGLTNPRMELVAFMDTPFFERELAATQQKVQGQKAKRKAADVPPQGRLCRFCHLVFKQGPDSPNIHTGFPGVAGKYVYCPAKVFSLYQDQGMEKELTWGEFKGSAFYEAEKLRWLAEKGK
ncbi:uncharacterized protein [Osmerus mordax]|uniref:uncharacterized protein n=1 Tax=Osmerus mordax TaxID=8014 RepID=UPI0035109080